MSIMKDFKKFAMRGNVIDLAVGVIIGVAFGKVVASFVSDILMPPIGMLLGGVDFSGLFINLSRIPVSTLAEAKLANLPVITYGMFFDTIINFIIQVSAIFVIVHFASKLSAPPVAPSVKRKCPFCFSEIDDNATRCPHCTSMLEL